MTTKQINKELDRLRKLRQKAYTKMQDTPKAKRSLKCKRVLIYHAQQLSIVSVARTAFAGASGNIGGNKTQRAHTRFGYQVPAKGSLISRRNNSQ